jgi:hypothetical protein
MTGLRKFWFSVLSLASFTFLMWINPKIDPLNLGLALTFLNGSFVAANAFIHAKGKVENKNL